MAERTLCTLQATPRRAHTNMWRVAKLEAYTLVCIILRVSCSVFLCHRRSTSPRSRSYYKHWRQAVLNLAQLERFPKLREKFR